MDVTASSIPETQPWRDPALLPDTELARLLRRLEATEKTLSRRRAVLHDRIDFVRGGVSSEIYAAGDQLEVLQQREREIAEERRLLHERIDALVAERGRRRAVAGTS